MPFTSPQCWFDPRHTGALRVINFRSNRVQGSDPGEAEWSCPFRFIGGDGWTGIEVDFQGKRSHKGKKKLVARFRARQTRLEWEDGNVWFRVGHDPLPLLLRTQPFSST